MAMVRRWMLLGLTLFGAQSATAQSGVPLATMESCAAITRDADRLACYDKAVEAVSATARANAASRDKLAQDRAAEARRAELAAAKQAELDRARAFGKPAEPDETAPTLTANVTEIRPTADRRSIVTLDNGQVWRQTDALSSLILRPGTPVVIKRGRTGSYRMVVEGKPGVMWVIRSR